MSWRAITEEDVKSSGLTGPELNAARTVALASGITDTLSDVLARITSEIRGYVAASPKNTLGPDGTIPEELITASLARIVFELTLRIPRAILLTDQRGKSNDNALTLLRDVAKGNFAIVPPTAPTESQAGVSEVRVISAPPRQATRDKLSGL